MAYSSQGSHTGQLDFCNWLADGIMWLALRSVKSHNVDFLNQIRYFLLNFTLWNFRLFKILFFINLKLHNFTLHNFTLQNFTLHDFRVFAILFFKILEFYSSVFEVSKCYYSPFQTLHKFRFFHNSLYILQKIVEKVT